MAKYITKGGKHYGTVDDVVNRIEALEAENAMLRARKGSEMIDDSTHDINHRYDAAWPKEARILAALDPAPDHAEWDAAIEAAARRQAMSAPERIYLDGDAEAGDGYFTRCFETAKPCSEPAIEYVRADLAPTSDERVKRLVEAARPFSAAVFNDNGDVTISTGHLKRQDWLKLRAALARLEGDKP